MSSFVSLIDKAIPFWVGKRTVIVGLITAIVQFLRAFGVAVPEDIDKVLAVLLAGFGAANLARK